MMRSMLWLTLFTGCTGPDDPDKPAPTTPAPTTPAPTTPAPTTPAPTTPALALSDAAASLDDDIGSIVWVDWAQSADATVHVAYSFDDGVWLASPDRPLAAGAHRELLLGIPFDVDVTWRIEATDAAGTVTTADAVVHTAAPDEAMPVPTLHAADATGYDPDRPWLLASVDSFANDRGTWTEILDRQGRVVWAWNTVSERWTAYPQPSADGTTLLLDENSLFAIFDGGALGEVVERTIDGAEVHRFATPGLHQPFTGMPDGSILYARQYGTYLEDVTQVHRDGTTAQLFDCDAWRQDQGIPSFCSANTLKRDATTGNLWLTEFPLSTTIEVDPVAHTALRWFGRAPGSYEPVPPEAAMVYPHGAHLTDAGTLLTSDSEFEGYGEMFVREYALDPVAETMTEVWSFGIGEGVTGYGFGDAVRLPGGNTLQNCGVARAREVTPAGDVVWDVEWTHPVFPFLQMGMATPLQDLYAMAPARD